MVWKGLNVEVLAVPLLFVVVIEGVLWSTLNTAEGGTAVVGTAGWDLVGWGIAGG